MTIAGLAKTNNVRFPYSRKSIASADLRFKSVIVIALLWLLLPALAQDADYPTLGALANLEVPAFNYVEMLDRMTRQDPVHVPPANPPEYEIGARESFTMVLGQDLYYESVEMELRGMTERVLIWVQDGIDYPRWRARQMAQRLETYVLDPMQRLFQYAEPPGVDGDPRLYVALILDPDGASLGYFHKTSTRPQHLYAESNQHEMLVVNLDADEEYDFFDNILIEVVAHEYLHILHYHSDFGEELWLDEGLASYAGYIAGKSFLSRGSAHSFGDGFLEAPQTGLTQWQAVEEKRPKYGAAFLFVLYLAQRFGDDIAPALLKEKTNGWSSIVKVLGEYTDVSADEVFADWALANYFLDSRRGYGYRALEADLSAPKPAASYNSFPAEHEGYLPQYSTEYIMVDVRGGDKLYLRLWQDEDARLIDEDSVEGDHFYYAVTSDFGNSRLTREFDLSAVDRAVLGYRVWYDLDRDNEYGYITISKDNGVTWEALSGIFTKSSDVYEDFYQAGYTGSTANWFPETINLSAYAPGRILLGFEVNSSYGTTYGGMAIDDLRISAIDYHEGFESPDDSWDADGWIRTDNRLPNNTWLQVVQDTRDGLHISRSLIYGNGDLTVDLLPGVSQVLVAVSPVVPRTSLKTEYDLELYLMNAAGEVMVVSRECTVTTTHALNFRATPNGTKIGLVPKGTALDASYRDGDWFMVTFNGVAGWVHGDYVHTVGNCP